MAIAGALIGGALGGYGKKVKVPMFEAISPDQVQQQTVAGNIASFGDISKLAASVNTFNQDQLNALLDKALPGAREQIQSNILSQLKGEVPKDVARAISRSNAERGVGVFQGSPFRSNIEARDIGLTSLQQIDRGLASAESWLSRAAAPQMDATAMFFSPQQRLGFAQSERNSRLSRDLMEAQVKAAPDPATAALTQEIDRFFNTMVQSSMSMGGIMGGAAASGAAQGYASRAAGGGSMQQSGGFNDWGGELNLASGAGGAGGASLASSGGMSY